MIRCTVVVLSRICKALELGMGMLYDLIVLYAGMQASLGSERVPRNRDEVVVMVILGDVEMTLRSTSIWLVCQRGAD